jgi:hypothetical protein
MISHKSAFRKKKIDNPDLWDNTQVTMLTFITAIEHHNPNLESLLLNDAVRPKQLVFGAIGELLRNSVALRRFEMVFRGPIDLDVRNNDTAAHPRHWIGPLLANERRRLRRLLIVSSAQHASARVEPATGDLLLQQQHLTALLELERCCCDDAPLHYDYDAAQTLVESMLARNGARLTRCAHRRVLDVALCLLQFDVEVWPPYVLLEIVDRLAPLADRFCHHSSKIALVLFFAYNSLRHSQTHRCTFQFCDLYYCY